MTRLPAAERRRQLLEVAARLFFEHGYHGATTLRLATESGVTEPILYQHFADKQDLFLVLVDEQTTEALDRWRSTLDACSSTQERLGVLTGGPPGSAFSFLVRVLREPAPDRAIGEGLRMCAACLHDFLRRELASLRRTGEVLVDQPAAPLAWIVLERIVGSETLAERGAATRSRKQTRALMTKLLSLE